MAEVQIHSNLSDNECHNNAVQWELFRMHIYSNVYLYLYFHFQVNLIIIRPTAQAIVALTFAYYALQPIYQMCSPPDVAVRLLAAICISKSHPYLY